MTIKEIHDYIVFILNKETTGYVSHNDIDTAIDRGQMSKFMELYGNPKQYQPGRPIPPIAYGQTQKISDDLRFFKRREQFTSTSAGIIEFTNLTEYLHLLGVYVVGTLNNTPSNTYVVTDGTVAYSAGTSSRTFAKPVKVVSEDQLADRLVSQVSAPSTTSPIGILGDSGNKIQLFPEVEHSGYIMYLSKPIKPLFSHVVDGRKIVHNSTSSAATFTAGSTLTLPDGTIVNAGATYTLPGSIELNWAEDCVNDIINKALSSLGVHLEDQNVTQYTEVKNQTGL
jgi:hypothetical protein|tara:strand:- start:2350 stop:3198 length:849 start_codon:yes stop_codon:yes gene_type:complete